MSIYVWSLSQNVANRLQCDLQNLKSWFDVDVLKLNGNKSEFILFKPSRVSHCDSSFCLLFVGCSELYPLKSARYLGLVFDEDLRWKVHVDAASCQKCSQKIGALRKYSRCLTMEAKQSSGQLSFNHIWIMALSFGQTDFMEYRIGWIT